MSTDGKRTSDLPAYTTPQTNDLLYIVDAAAGSQGSKHITFDDLINAKVQRRIGNIIFVPGVDDGDTDTAAVQAALTALTGVDDGTVLLSGKYYWNAKITVPAGVCLRGYNRTIITSRATPDDYALYSEGPLEDFYLQISGSARRGIHIKDVRYRQAVRNLQLYGASQIGLFVDDCWFSEISMVTFSQCNDIVLDTYRPNRSSFTDISMNGCVTTSVDGCAFQLRTSDNVLITNLNVEGSTLQNPAVRIKDSYGYTFTNLSMEANDHDGHPIVHSASANNAFRPQTFHGMSVGGSAGITPPKALLEFETTSAVILSGAHTASISDNLIILNGGEHTRPVIFHPERVRNIAENDFVSLQGGATYDTGTPMYIPS